MVNKFRLLLAIIITFILVITWLPKIFYYKKTKNLIKLNELRVKTFIKIYKWLGGISLEIDNTNVNLDINTPYIVCANHSSYFDIGCMLVTTYKLGLKNAFFITKKELSKNFLIKHHILYLDVLIDRYNKLDAVRGFRKATEKLKSGSSLLIFPEGTISKEYPPKIQDFKQGAFSLAIKLQIPILPITITNAWKIIHNVGQVYGLGKGTMNVIVHKPIETTNLNSENIDALTQKVYNVINDSYIKNNENLKN